MDVLRVDLVGKKEEEKKELRKIHEKEMGKNYRVPAHVHVHVVVIFLPIILYYR